MNLDLEFLKKSLIGTTVPKPISGTLSGHAAGEPFDKHVYDFLKNKFPGETFRQYEFLNDLYLKNQAITSPIDRALLVEPPALSFLLNRGFAAINNWSPKNLFEEKQNDTADIVIIKNKSFHLIDVKTFNKVKDGQPPNIISAYKLAKMCRYMLEAKVFDSHDITYVGITWELEKSELKCIDVFIKKLFKIDPRNLYINWAAALQIQFHVEKIDQSYTESVENWCSDYLNNFVKRADARTDIMIEKFDKPFRKFLK
jgi:type II restriction enzyme